MKNIPLYEAIYEGDEDEIGAAAISLVKHPAIKLLAVQLEEEKKRVKLVSEQKKQLLTAILIPDYPIYRNDNQLGEYNLVFSKETIEKTAHAYLEKYRQKNATYDHGKIIEGVTLIESWIVDDTEKDKSAVYGLELPQGTWVGLFQLTDELWTEYVETGKVQGVSIEAFYIFKRKVTAEEVVEYVKQTLENV